MALKDDTAVSGPSLRPSGYVSRFEEIWYGFSSPLYDWLVWWCFLPLGGERRCRGRFVDWMGIEAGQEIVSLCCGTGTMERAILAAVSDARVVAVDLGAGQIATARAKETGGRVDYRLGDASRTGLPSGRFDRALITLALHEMPRDLRLAVLAEAARLVKPGGRVVAIEHARPRRRWSACLRSLWWFTWVPGNPERATTADLQRRGLANEMREAGLEILERHVTDPDWIEGVAGRPAGSSP